MPDSRVEWNGDAVLDAVAAAAIDVLDDTLADCVTQSKETVHVITAVLQGSIMTEPAKRVSKNLVAARWGSFDVEYALAEETLHPFLRPAADKYYPNTGKRIQEHMKHGLK